MNSNRRPGETPLVFYFLFLGVLSAFAQAPYIAIFVAIFTAGTGLFVLVAAPTILVYSVSLLPIWIALTNRPRWWSTVVFALLFPPALAIAPGLLSQKTVRSLAEQADHDDHSRSSLVKPKTLEVIGDDLSGVFEYGQQIGDGRASCSELCRRLLFNHEIEWVRMSLLPRGLLSPTHRVTYHVENRPVCPKVYPDGTKVEKAFEERLAAGECLIADSENLRPADAVINLSTLHDREMLRPSPNSDLGPEEIKTIKRLVVTQRENNKPVELVRRTEIAARPIVLPFYFGYEDHFLRGNRRSGTVLGRIDQTINAIDLIQITRSTFAFDLSPLKPTQDPTQVAGHVLSLSTEAFPAFTAPQQHVLDNALKALEQQPSLSDGDVDFIRRVLADVRVSDRDVGTTFLKLCRKFRQPLERLIPVALEKLKVQPQMREREYHGQIGWAISEYPAESLKPYADQIISLLEAQDDWWVGGLLSRAGELDVDTSELIKRRLKSDSDSVRRFAALAACRAPVEMWENIEPVALSIVEKPIQGWKLEDDTRKLMLGLIRHGKKATVEKLIESGSTLKNKEWMKNQLSKLQPGMSADHCRDFL
jgi:hypothetical protein